MPEIVITGLGAVSPYGVGVAALWEGLLRGETAIAPLDLFDTSGHRTRIGGQVPEAPRGLERERDAAGRAERLSRTDRFAIDAAREALADAGFAQDAPELRRAGLFFGSSTGGMFEAERVLLADPTSALARRFSHVGGQVICAPAIALARDLALGGPVETVTSACSASTMALEAALMSLESGEVELAIAGGADALCELTYSGFNSLRAIDERPARPFRADREGLSIGEGSGMLVLETAAHARARGATVLAVLAGAGSSCDAYHMTAPHPEGKGAIQALERALGAADRGAVAFVNAHGTGTPHNDVAEAQALRAVLGERLADVAVTSTKGAVGHLLGACGALEAVVTVRGLVEGVVPQTPGDGPVDPEAGVALVLGAPARPAPCAAALSTNLAFGGANAALHLRAAGTEGA